MPSSGFKKCALDRKSTRLNSSHTLISYAVFCLKKIKSPCGVLHHHPVHGPAQYRPDPRVRPTVCPPTTPPGPGPRTSGLPPYLQFFFFNDPATPEIYTLSLHGALPI